MATHEVQTDARPTNKALTTAAGTVGALPLILPAVQEVWPQIAPVALQGPAFTALIAAALSSAVGLGIAWFVRDRVGIPSA